MGDLGTGQGGRSTARSYGSSWVRHVAAAGLVLAIGALYVGGAARRGELGYPLDDGWIHQTYARNVARSGRFSYVDGAVSTGSTSPLWTVALSLAYVLRMPPILWSYLLGGLSWLLTGWAAARLTGRLFPQRRALATWVGAACLLEWHLAWASFSGMETALFTFLSLLLMERYVACARPIAIGLLGGLLVLARPEGSGLVVLVVVATAAETLRLDRAGSSAQRGRFARRLAGMAAGLALLLLPYLALNWAASGQLLPNTFYAKQAEYEALLAQPFLARLWRVARRPATGGQVLLLPGFLWAALSCLRPHRQSRSEGLPLHAVLVRLLPLAWWAAYLGTYALRMPADYQYGRYVMPTIPILLLYGVVGTASWLRLRSVRMVARALSRAAVAAIACLFAAFLAIGQQAYVGDVCLINCEMVRVGRWLDEKTPPDALVAAHDIGAIGYLSGRRLLDLAGLVTPEVIPVMRDEPRLAEFIVVAGAGYLVTFPSWYPWITKQAAFVRVYQTDCALTRERGGDNMAVYAIRPGSPTPGE